MTIARDLRAFCRPPLGVPVSFGGVTNYTDDGSQICGNFDRPVQYDLGGGGGGAENAKPELRLPFNAFDPMPANGDHIEVDGVEYKTSHPREEDDGGFFVYELRQV